MKFSVMNFFRKCEPIRKKLENFIYLCSINIGIIKKRHVSWYLCYILFRRYLIKSFKTKTANSRKFRLVFFNMYVKTALVLEFK